MAQHILAVHWLEDHARHRVRESTYASYKHIVRHHLIPGLGHIKTQSLAPAQIQKFYSAKMDAGCSARTVLFCHKHLAQALDVALREGIVARKVTDAVTPPRVVRKEMVIWSPEEARRFLAAALESTYGPIWLVIAATGLRRGEALGLRLGVSLVDRSVTAPVGENL